MEVTEKVSIEETPTSNHLKLRVEFSFKIGNKIKMVPHVKTNKRVQIIWRDKDSDSFHDKLIDRIAKIL